VAERAADELVSLPLHPRLRDEDLERVTEAVNGFQRGRVLA
jgi:dTDP-4-amino-4,6-dideoxygalactose transaminase